MNKKEAFAVVERVMVRRIHKATTAVNAVAELEIDATELLETLKEEREALKVMREVFGAKGATQ